jgi:hypothetical protein
VHGVGKTPATRPRSVSVVVGEVRDPWAAPMRRIGRYSVLGTLGRGGMGEVYAAFDEHLRRRVAIKRINRRSEDEHARRRSLREAQALARLAHPNIVTVYEAIEVDAQLCIVMELVVGQTLREWLAAKPRSRGEILEVFVQAGRGLAAAHAAGLVHRDLKPDNLMIGDDRRVRVMDFGLARGVEGGEEAPECEATWPHPADPLFGSITRNGAFIGTPGYMAPEQHLGLTTDERTDVFGFCVVAFEALHGRRPFQGRDDAAVREATLAGRIVTPPGGKLPAWLDAVIRRGLDVEPAARWPTMEALLDALARDPLARRRWRWRSFALVVLAGVLATAVAAAVAALREASERARSETAAATRLSAVETTIAQADAATAEAAFRAFVSDPEHQHTRALTRAWLGHGDRQQADPTAARAAYAEAYVSAQTDDDEQAALRSLSLRFFKDWDGVGLGRGVGLLRARGVDDLTLAELGFQAALWRRDLGAAKVELAHEGHPQAGWRPLVTHLSRSRSVPLTVGALTLLPAGTPARIAVRDTDSTEVVLLDATLTEVGRWRDESLITLVPETSWAIAQTEREARVVDVTSGAILGRGAPGITPFAAFDATDDGVPELFFGRHWPLYGFHRWDGLGMGATLERDAHPGTDASDSTFDAHAVVDVDGDGVDELAIGFGPWHRFDLRVFRPDARGELELISEKRLGRIGALAPVNHGTRRLLAAFVDNSCPAPELFPEPPHVGGPPGVHFFEWVRGELVEVDFIALPRGDSFGTFTARDLKAVGDLDGDGLDDVAFTLFGAQGPWLLVLRQTGASFEPLLIAGIKLFAGIQLDDDAPLELLVQRTDDAELLVLGLGDGPTPPLPQPVLTPSPPPPPTLTDRLLVERWNQANDLAALAQVDSAAASLRDAALLVTDRPTKSALLDRAGELFASSGRMLEVLALEHAVHDDPRARARALLRRAQALSQLGRHEEALAEAEALLGTPERTAQQTEIAAALVQDLSALLTPDLQIEVGFDVPLAPQWRLSTPGALRRDPTRSVLEFEIPATKFPVAELPIEWDGGPLSLEFELDIERLEFAACVEISIVDASDARWLGGAYCGQGGGGRLQQASWFKLGSAPWTIHALDSVQSGIQERTVHPYLAYFPTQGYAHFMVLKEGAVALGQSDVATPPKRGPYRLLVGSFVNSSSASLALGDILRIRVRGARLGSSSAGDLARERPAQLLAEHEPRAALEALAQVDPPIPRAALLRLLAFEELGDLAGVAMAASAVLAHADDPRWLGGLALVLRRHPLAAAAVRSAAGPVLLPALAAVWSFASPHRNDPRIRGEILDGMQELERLVPGNSAERDALRTLLDTRAELWRRSGEPERARRDTAAAATLSDVPRR